MPDTVLEYLDEVDEQRNTDPDLVMRLSGMLRNAVTCLRICYPDDEDAVRELERLDRMAKEAGK